MKSIFHRAVRLKDILFASGIGLYLGIGLALSVLSLWLFWSVAEDVLEGDSIVLFDTALAQILHSQATPLSTNAYLIISWFGSQGIIVLSIVFAAFYTRRRRWLNFTIGLITLGGGTLLNHLIKQVVMRPRPIFANPLALEQSYSFPSAHAMMSLIAYGLIGYLLWSATRNRYAKIFIVFGAVLFILLIGISRLTLGVHYFSDVVGGFAAGALWLGICISAISFLKRHPTLPDSLDL